jgi:hypothetical protein
VTVLCFAGAATERYVPPGATYALIGDLILGSIGVLLLWMFVLSLISAIDDANERPATCRTRPTAPKTRGFSADCQSSFRWYRSGSGHETAAQVREDDHTCSRGPCVASVTPGERSVAVARQLLDEASLAVISSAVARPAVRRVLASDTAATEIFSCCRLAALGLSLAPATNGAASIRHTPPRFLRQLHGEPRLKPCPGRLSVS